MTAMELQAKRRFERGLLSPREQEILTLVADGWTGEAIAERLTVSVETVRTHLRNAQRKLNARTRPHAVAIAIQRAEILPEEAEAPDVGAPPRSQAASR